MTLAALALVFDQPALAAVVVIVGFELERSYRVST